MYHHAQIPIYLVFGYTEVLMPPFGKSLGIDFACKSNLFIIQANGVRR